MSNNPQQPSPQQPGFSQPSGQPQGHFAAPQNVAGQNWGNQGFGNQGFGSQWGGPQQFPGQAPMPYQPAPYPPTAYPPTAYPQGTSGQFGGPAQQYPVPYQPAPAPKRSILPAVLIVAVALVAVIGLVKLTQDDGGGGSETPTSRYQHDDYKIPPVAAQHPDLPWPTSEAEVKAWLQNNAIYAQQIAVPVRCELPAFDHSTATSDQKKAQLEKTLVCLVRVWGPTVEAAGFTITHPTVTMYDAPIQNACGKAETHNAFYCGADQNLYFATDVHEILGPKKNDPWAYEAVMAHEFGHSVQGRTGIIPAKAIMSENATDEAGKLEPTRRNEAQADCLAGLFFNSVHESMGLSPDQVRGIGDFFGQTGNPDPNTSGTHPQAPIRVKWFGIGSATTNVGSCNTFIAPLDEVK